MTAITSTEGPWGSYSKSKECSSAQTNPIVGIRMQIEGIQNSGDDTAANNVYMSCWDGQPLNAAVKTNWGSLTDWAYCPPGKAVAGLQTRVEANQGGGDDTAL